MLLKSLVVVVVVSSLSASAFAAPTPPKALLPLEPGLPELKLKVDFRNLMGPQNAGKLDEKDMEARLESANEVWNQCSVRFVARSVSNISSVPMGIPYTPKSQDDLGKIATALNPNGFGAIPLTVAGPWNFFDSGSGLYLNGLGWVFVNEKGLDRIGAMISANKFFDRSAGPIIAHELAHALSLPHAAEAKNLMGAAGTNDLTVEQCRQARRFAELTLREFLL